MIGGIRRPFAVGLGVMRARLLRVRYHELMAESSDTIRIFGTAPDSIVDGPGLRYAVFTQGCSHDCPGCHNPESHDPAGGTTVRLDDIVADIRKNGLIQGVTFSGGDPFEQPAACAELARRIRAELRLGIWCYTGYLYEELIASEDPAVHDLLGEVDVLVDGPFVQSLKSYTLVWKGSSNQRVIDMAATRDAGAVVLWESRDDFPTKPASW